MADTGIFCTTAEVGYKAGLGKSATSSAEAYVNNFVTQAESFINVATRKNFSDVYSSLNVDVKGILKEAASNLAAIYVINYDYVGYPTISHVEDMIKTLYKRAFDCINILKDNKMETFMVGA